MASAWGRSRSAPSNSRSLITSTSTSATRESSGALPWRSSFLGGIARATALQWAYRGYILGGNRPGRRKEQGHVREAVRRWSLVFYLERGPARRLRTLRRGDVGRRDDRPRDGTLAGLRLHRDGDHRGGGKGHLLPQRHLAGWADDPCGQGDAAPRRRPAPAGAGWRLPAPWRPTRRGGLRRPAVRRG